MVVAVTARIHLNSLRITLKQLRDYQIPRSPPWFLPAAKRCRRGKLQPFTSQLSPTPFGKSATKEKLILGICKTVSRLVLKAGCSFPADEDGPLATLATKTPHSGRYEDRWIHMQATREVPLLKASTA